MSFNKIQPEQIQLPTFFSNSGDFVFSDLSTGFKLELSRGLTGNFNIVGNLTLDSKNVLRADSSLIYNKASGMLIGGTNNTISGLYNVVVNGNNNTIGGLDNTVLFGNDSVFDDNSSQNTLICGNTITFASGVTGSAMLGDNASVRSINESNVLYIDFSSGVKVMSDIILSGSAYLGESPIVSQVRLTGNSGDGSFLQDDGTTTTGGIGSLLVKIGNTQLRITGVIYGTGT